MFETRRDSCNYRFKSNNSFQGVAIFATYEGAFVAYAQKWIFRRFE